MNSCGVADIPGTSAGHLLNLADLKQDCSANMQVVSTRTTEVVIACKVFLCKSRNAGERMFN